MRKEERYFSWAFSADDVIQTSDHVIRSPPYPPNGTIYTQPVSFSGSYLAVVSICICILFLSALVIFPLIRIVIFSPSASVILW